MFAFASKEFTTPNRSAVAGINCINPRAPLFEISRGLKIGFRLDDCRHERGIDVEFLCGLDNHLVVLRSEDRTAAGLVVPRAFREDTFLDHFRNFRRLFDFDEFVVDDALDASEADRHRAAVLEGELNGAFVDQLVSADLHRTAVGEERNARARRKGGEQGNAERSNSFHRTEN